MHLANACQLARAEWDRFYSQLEKHEEGHEALWIEMANKIADDTIGLRVAAYGCTYEAARDSAENRLQDRWDKIITDRTNEYSAKQTKYDANNPVTGLEPVVCPP
jgi:predicted secreted Zn-dependent protease